MNYIMRLFSNTPKIKASQTDMDTITKLKHKLVDVGFAPEEVDFMVRRHIKKKGSGELSSADIKTIEKALNEQLDIAYKCLNLIKEQKA